MGTLYQRFRSEYPLSKSVGQPSSLTDRLTSWSRLHSMRTVDSCRLYQMHENSCWRLWGQLSHLPSESARITSVESTQTRRVFRHWWNRLTLPQKFHSVSGSAWSVMMASSGERLWSVSYLLMTFSRRSHVYWRTFVTMQGGWTPSKLSWRSSKTPCRPHLCSCKWTMQRTFLAAAAPGMRRATGTSRLSLFIPPWGTTMRLSGGAAAEEFQLHVVGAFTQHNHGGGDPQVPPTHRAPPPNWPSRHQQGLLYPRLTCVPIQEQIHLLCHQLIFGMPAV